MLVKKILCSAVLVLGIFGLTTSASFAQDYNNGYYYQPNTSYQYQQPYNYNYTQPVQYQQPCNYNYSYAQPQYPIQPVYQSNGYYDPNYQQPAYQQQYSYSDNTRAAKIKKAVTYGALGAGAGYLFSKPGSRGKNTAIGAGLGAALGYLLKGY